MALHTGKWINVSHSMGARCLSTVVPAWPSVVRLPCGRAAGASGCVWHSMLEEHNNKKKGKCLSGMCAWLAGHDVPAT